MAQGEAGELIENFTVVGTPTIEDRVLTATTASSYIQTPEAFNPGSNPWEITFKLYRRQKAGAYEKFIQGDGLKLVTAWQSTSTQFYLYSADSTITNGSKSRTVSVQVDSWIKIAFSGTKYDFGVSTDGVNYSWLSNASVPFTGFDAISSSVPIKPGVLKFGNNSKASIYLLDTVVKINGSVWWTPYVRG